ncbi:unnamed protein product [Rotaria sp. Silwood2]|nr:unnamed protein product [Rotaria sp. Silwood2]CAF2982437.1 unnamed protein product [Rotaria sp. Silwood2]CAF3353627.1 unnamed protein product [Rotaria sp. Silwood2]CAF4017070.1 unnamed protein product [Rotaria sp. Silwood2]CAF4098775.1 unnamed protein product [Rotaria sp. Silwood2]
MISSSSTISTTMEAEETTVLMKNKHTTIAMTEDSTALSTAESPTTFPMVDEYTAGIRLSSSTTTKAVTFNSEMEFLAHETSNSDE